MRKLLLVFACIALTASLFSFESGYNTTKSLYDAGLYGDLPGEAAQPQQGAVKQAEAWRKSLGDIVVTARNIPETISLVPKSVEVINTSDTGVFGSTSLKDILDDLPGAFVNRMGIGEAMSSLSLRGAASRYTLIMQDGIPLNDILTGGVDLNMIDTSGVDRIEVVKGGMSSVYGSNAVAGVVNVITGKEEKKLALLTAGYGTCGLVKYGAASNYRIFNVDYSASIMDESMMEYFENSDSVKRSASAKIKFTNGLLDSQLTGHYFRREMGVAFDSFGYASPEARQFDEAFSAGVNETVNLDFMKVKVDGYLRSSDLRFDNPAAWIPQHSKNIKKEYQAGLYAMYEENAVVSVVAGYESNVKQIDSNMAGARSIMNNAAISNAAAKLFNESLVVNAGARVDVNSQFGTYASENVSAKYRFQDGLEIMASFDRSFSAPNFGELYWPETVDVYGNTTYVMRGNENLKVEEFTTYEAGIQKKQDRLKESVTWFYRDSTNMISWTDTVVDGGPAGVTVTSTMTNISGAKTMGLEVELEFSPFDFWKIALQYNLLFIEDGRMNTGSAYVDGGNANNKTYRLFTSFDLPYKVKLGITADYVDYKQDYRGKELAPYFLMNATLTQQLSQNVEIYLQVENVLDEKSYHVVADMPMPGRIVIAGAKLDF